MAALAVVALTGCSQKEDYTWVKKSIDRATSQLLWTAEEIAETGKIPRSTWAGYDEQMLARQMERDFDTFKDSLRKKAAPELMGKRRLGTVYDWTSGFFPGSLWYAYEFTGRDDVKAAAENFNKVAAEQGKDEFGRTIKVAQNTEGPFYAMQMHIRYCASLGGLHVNNDMQVLNTNQEAISGLYAAGEVIGGHQGDVYMGGCLFAYAICSGHNAGAAASAAIAK